MATDETRTLSPVRTTGDVKAEIERSLGIPRQTQILLLGGLNLLGDDNEALNSRDNFNHDHPMFDPETLIQVYTKISTRKVVSIGIFLMRNPFLQDKLCFYSDDTVLSFKKEINKKHGISPSRQRLNTLGYEPSDDDQICDFYIEDLKPRSQEIFMTLAPLTNPKPLLVTIEINEELHSILMDRVDTVYTLCSEVVRRGLVQQGCNFYFSMDDQKLEGDMTFEHYNANDLLVLSYGTNFGSQATGTTGTGTGDDDQSFE